MLKLYNKNGIFEKKKKLFKDISTFFRNQKIIKTHKYECIIFIWVFVHIYLYTYLCIQCSNFSDGGFYKNYTKWLKEIENRRASKFFIWTCWFLISLSPSIFHMCAQLKSKQYLIHKLNANDETWNRYEKILPKVRCNVTVT